MAVLCVTGLRKQYANVVAVDGVSFEVNPHEIVGLLGPNGAGKTTTINMILGVLEPTAGTIRIEDLDVATRRSGPLQRGKRELIRHRTIDPLTHPRSVLVSCGAFRDNVAAPFLR